MPCEIAVLYATENIWYDEISNESYYLEIFKEFFNECVF